MAWILSAAAAAITLPPVAPPLPPPSGNVVTVSTVNQLQSAVAALTSGTTIVIVPGTYDLTQTLVIGGGVTNVALRGATDSRDDVVLRGSGMATPGVNIGIQCRNAQNVLVANLSIGDVFWHPLQLQGEQGCDAVHLYNLRLFDAGEQFVKGTVDFANPNGVDNGIVEYCLIEYTVIGPADGYTNGVDIHNGDGWIIRYNLFRNIRVPLGAPTTLGPAVLMWSGSSNTVCHSNAFIECERAIAFGLGPQSGFAHSHSGGLICNNFVYRETSVQVDTSINVWDSPGTKVLHNTVIQNGTYPNAIEYRFAGTTGVVLENNLTDGAIQARDGATGTVAGNVTNAAPALFVDASACDLHLIPSAASAIDQGVGLADCPSDLDGDARPYGVGRDVGADEWSGFLDVPASNPFHDYIDAIARNGVTAGCGDGNYCPDASVTRGEMAVFLLKSKFGAGYLPPPATGIFDDVPPDHFAIDWIEDLYNRGITAGCLGASSGKYFGYFSTIADGVQGADLTSPTGQRLQIQAIQPFSAISWSGGASGVTLKAAHVTITGYEKDLLVGATPDDTLRVAEINSATGVATQVAAASAAGHAASAFDIAVVNDEIFIFSAEGIDGLRVYRFQPPNVILNVGTYLSGNYNRVSVRGPVPFPVLFAHRKVGGSETYIDIYDSRWLTEGGSPLRAKSLRHTGAPEANYRGVGGFEALVQQTGPVWTVYLYRETTTAPEPSIHTDKLDVSCVAVPFAPQDCGILLGSNSIRLPGYTGTLPGSADLSTGGGSGYLYVLTQWGFARGSLADPSNPGGFRLLNIGRHLNNGIIPITCDCFAGGGTMDVAESPGGNARMVSDWLSLGREGVGGLPAMLATTGSTPPPTNPAFGQQINLSTKVAGGRSVAAIQTNPIQYCPDAPVTRAEMAVFLLKTLFGAAYLPPPAAGIFQDVPANHFAIDWIEDLYSRNITAGCQASPLKYCPDDPNTRGQMAVFLVRTFSLQ